MILLFLLELKVDTLKDYLIKHFIESNQDCKYSHLAVDSLIDHFSIGLKVSNYAGFGVILIRYSCYVD